MRIDASGWRAAVGDYLLLSTGRATVPVSAVLECEWVSGGGMAFWVIVGDVELLNVFDVGWAGCDDIGASILRLIRLNVVRRKKK
jgi:hypothetical protein